VNRARRSILTYRFHGCSRPLSTLSVRGLYFGSVHFPDLTGMQPEGVRLAPFGSGIFETHPGRPARRSAIMTLNDFATNIYHPHRARAIRHVMSLLPRKYETALDVVQDAALEIIASPGLIAEFPGGACEQPPYWWLNRVRNAGRRNSRAVSNYGLAVQEQFNALILEHGTRSGVPIGDPEQSVEPLDVSALAGPRETATAAQAEARAAKTTEQWLNVTRGAGAYNPKLAQLAKPRKPYTRTAAPTATPMPTPTPNT